MMTGQREKKFRKSTIDLSNSTNYALGKVPPQAIELEKAVLGAILLEKKAIDIVVELLKPECFYSEAHQKIFTSIMALYEKRMPIDELTLVEQLKFDEILDSVGGPFSITKLTNNVVSGAHVEGHCRIILQKFIQRELIRISGETINDAFADSTDVFDMLSEVENKIFDITNNHLKSTYDAVDKILVETVKRIENLRQRKGEMTGVPSGYDNLDSITFGWQPTDLIILAARPSVGKTAFALNLAMNAALHPTFAVPVGFFSLEMSSWQLVQRILSAESEIWLEKISRGQLEEHEMKKLYVNGVQPLLNSKIYIDDTPGLNIFELRAKCRRMKSKHNVGLIIIDYLQLMGGNSEGWGNREQEISKISRELKTLAKEINVPIIALSQLSRDVEKRKEGNKMPQLSDLRESGAIEQDADMVMFLYRPEYYDITANEFGENNKGETHIKIAKHRNGSLQTIKLKALLHIQKFIEYSESELSQNQNWKPVENNLSNLTEIDDDDDPPPF